MDKMKLAICMKDLEYQTRFVNCFMNHYKHQYEVHVFTNLEELKMAKPLEFSVIITGEYTTEELTDFVERGEIVLALTETGIGDKKEEHLENIFFTEKYQEVYKIEEFLPRLAVEREGVNILTRRSNQGKWTGVYSLTREAYQIPFTALLAKLYGEEEKVIVLDLQNYSGLMDVEANVSHMGLEDLLSVATTGTYSKGRILDCVGHESNWDYVYPVKNNQCLMEGTEELYEIIVDILEKELGYQRIIINFGAMYSGQIAMMEQCQTLYLLCGREGSEVWRENTFFKELEGSEKGELLHKIQKIELPTVSGTDETWRTISDKWYWNSFGERIRQIMHREKHHAAVV